MKEHKEPLKEKDILCLGHLKRAFALLDGLHDVGCRRDRAGNRELFYDGYVKLILLHAWNLGMRHLLSQREEGLDIQIYCTLIVCLLIQLISGKKPNKAMRNIVGWHLIGLATAQNVIDFMNRPDNTGVKLRAKEALWKKLGV